MSSFACDYIILNLIINHFSLFDISRACCFTITIKIQGFIEN